MKKISLILTLVVAFAAANSVYGQGRYGATPEDSVNCVKYLSFYQEYMKQGNLKEASPLWRKAIAACPPTASQNMLLDGMKIMRKDISTYNSNPTRRKALVDSLMLLHEMRIKTYPNRVIPATTNKAIDMINLNSSGNEQNAFNFLGESMLVTKTKTAPVVMVRYMDFAKTLYEGGKMTPEQVMEAYQTVSKVAESVLQAKQSDENVGAVRDIENIFMQSGVANCDNLITLFTPRYEANPTDKDMLGTIVSLLIASDCVDSDLFLQAAEALHKTDPSFKSSYTLFKLYSNRGDNESAIKYMEEAIAFTESDDLQDGEYYYEMSTFYFKKIGNQIEAVRCAKRAAELNPAMAGKAYMLTGTIWGSQKCSGNEIEVRAPYWVAVDYLIKAKNADPSLAEEANNLISSYSKYYPLQADAFMFDVLDGASYTVSCNGMRETTRVRTQK